MNYLAWKCVVCGTITTDSSRLCLDTRCAEQRRKDMVTGIIIDGSHTDDLSFMVAVIEYAVDKGLLIEYDTFQKDVRMLQDGEWDEDIHSQIAETYYWAMDYLNDSVAPDYYYDVDDASLFRWRSDDVN